MGAQKIKSQQKQSIVNQQSTELEFKRTPGFQTIKRKDRRRAARFDITPYKPPKKPVDFVQFSPEKIKNSPSPVRKSVPLQNEKQEEEKNVFAPITPQKVKSSKKSKLENKPSLDLKPTVLITPPSKPKTPNDANNIFGLTTSVTPPPKLEKKPDPVPEAPTNTWKWGSNDEQ